MVVKEYLSDSDRAFLTAAAGGTEPPQRNAPLPQMVAQQNLRLENERVAALKEPNPKLTDKRIQALAVLIAVELSHQDNELDNLGDNESVVLQGKCPTINLVQLAEKIDTYYRLSTTSLKERISELERDIDRAHPGLLSFLSQFYIL